MKSYGLTDEALDATAAPYEGGKVYIGSHLDAIGKRGAPQFVT